MLQENRPVAVRLEEYLRKDAEAVRRYQQSALGQLTEGKSQFVVCGAGGMGIKVMRGLKAAGLKCVCFADKNPRLWGTFIENVPVLTPDLAAARFKDSSTFVMSVWGAYSRDRISERKKEWSAKGCNVISFMSIFWKYPDLFLPHYSISEPSKVFENRAAIMKALSALGDAESREEFLHQVRWRAELDYSELPEPSRSDIYFPDGLLKLREDEVFIDCGAYVGDTLAKFIEKTQGRFSKYVGLEPDSINFGALEFFTSGVAPAIREKLRIERAAIGSQDGFVTMSSSGLPSSTIGSPAGTERVRVLALESLCGIQIPTYVKMDIEGFEMEALRGGIDLIRKWRPKLAIAAYHFPEHIWEITNYLSERLKGYRFYLRPHDLEGWDVVLYAIPEEQS